MQGNRFFSSPLVSTRQATFVLLHLGCFNAIHEEKATPCIQQINADKYCRCEATILLIHHALYYQLIQGSPQTNSKVGQIVAKTNSNIVKMRCEDKVVFLHHELLRQMIGGTSQANAMVRQPDPLTNRRRDNDPQNIPPCQRHTCHPTRKGKTQ